MSVVLKKTAVSNIDDEYIQENIDEILDIMINLTEDKQKKGNWKRALKTDGASKNISYVGYAALHMICKRTEKMWDRIDSFYEKEAILSDNLRMTQERELKHQHNIDEFRQIQYKLIEKLKSLMKNYEYGEFVEDELSKYNRGYYGF